MSIMTKVVNIYRDRNYDEYIGRAGHGQDGYLGNPFKTDDKEHNIKMFRAYARARMKTDPVFRERVLSLKGKTLGCFCKPLSCHGDVYVELIKDYENQKTHKNKIVGRRVRKIKRKY